MKFQGKLCFSKNSSTFKMNQFGLLCFWVFFTVNLDCDSVTKVVNLLINLGLIC